MKTKYLPDYLEEYSQAFKESKEGYKEVCKKLDLILEAIYGDKKEKTVKDNANNQFTTETKKRGRKPKE